MYVENRLNIHTKAFAEILAEEARLRELKNRFPLQSPAWNAVWDKLDRVLERKRRYEAAVEKSRFMKGE
jgi:hypothetical protein